MMSSMFEIPILYVACGVKIVKKRRGVIFLLTCTSKNTVTKEIHVLAGFFFEKKLVLEENRRGAGERRIEQNRSYFYLKI